MTGLEPDRRNWHTHGPWRRKMERFSNHIGEGAKLAMLALL
jgi:hypothetical protein